MIGFNGLCLPDRYLLLNSFDEETVVKQSKGLLSARPLIAGGDHSYILSISSQFGDLPLATSVSNSSQLCPLDASLS